MVSNSPNPKKRESPASKESQELPLPAILLLERTLNRGGLQSDQQLDEFLEAGKKVSGFTEDELLAAYLARLRNAPGSKEDSLSYSARLSELLFKKTGDLEHILDSFYQRRELLRYYQSHACTNFYRDQIDYSPVRELTKDAAPSAPVVEALLQYGSLSLRSLRQGVGHFNLFPQKSECLVRQVIEILGYLDQHKDCSAVIARVERLPAEEARVGEKSKGKDPSIAPVSVSELRSALALEMCDQLHQMLSHRNDTPFWRSTISASTPLWGMRFMSAYVDRGVKFLANDWTWEGNIQAKAKSLFDRAQIDLEKLFERQAWTEAPQVAEHLRKEDADYEARAIRQILPLEGEGFEVWKKRMYVLQLKWLDEYQESRDAQTLHARGLDVRYLSYPKPHTIKAQF